MPSRLPAIMRLFTHLGSSERCHCSKQRCLYYFFFLSQASELTITSDVYRFLKRANYSVTLFTADAVSSHVELVSLAGPWVERTIPSWIPKWDARSVVFPSRRSEITTYNFWEYRVFQTRMTRQHFTVPGSRVSSSVHSAQTDQLPKLQLQRWYHLHHHIHH